jgi:hypothetical protein
MKLARSAYHYRSRRAAAAKIIVRDRIVALCDEFPRYGYRRVAAQLKAEGTTIIIRRCPASCVKTVSRCGRCAVSCASPTAIMTVRYSPIWQRPSVPRGLTSCGSPI